MGNGVDVSVSIVNYNTRDMLDMCLTALFETTQNLECEVIVVDNGSRDGSAEMVQHEFSQVKLIRNTENMFFTIANNQALRQARGRYVLIMNSDCLVRDGTVKRMVEFLDEHPEAGATSCVFLNRDGTVAPTCWQFRTPKSYLLRQRLGRLLFPNSTVVRTAMLSEWDRRSTRAVDVASDGFLLVRGEALAQVGLYDERFLAWGTEDDLCVRLHRKNWTVYHLADAEVLHYGEYTTNKQPLWRIEWLRKRDMVRYFRKYFGYWASVGVDLASTADLLVRILPKYIARSMKKGEGHGSH